MFVCLSVSMFRMAGQTAGPIETKLDTHSCPPRECFCQGKCQGHSCMRAGVTELRNTRNAARKRHLVNAAQTTSGQRERQHLANAYETPSGLRVITASVTRRRRRRAASAEGTSRTPSGGRVTVRRTGNYS